MKTWFPEPSAVDPTVAQYGERTFDWLRRSTWKRAVACRSFLNYNLGQLPQDWQPALFRAFETRDWDSVFFELFVARVLQILGARIEIEVPIPGRTRRPDFLAYFADGVVTVEAKTPKLNAEMRVSQDRNAALVHAIESLVPEGWAVAVSLLPKIGPAESKRLFKRVVGDVLRTLPPPTNAFRSGIELSVEFREGDLKMTAFPARMNSSRILAHGISVGMDDTEYRIQSIVRSTKKQVRKAATPVILAVNTSPWGSPDDFHHALFGKTFERVDQFGRTVEVGFDSSDGLFATPRTDPPTYAGVLGFMRVGFREVAEPVFFPHPRFMGELPGVFDTLERHSYEPGSGVHVVPARRRNYLHELNLTPPDV